MLLRRTQLRKAGRACNNINDGLTASSLQLLCTQSRVHRQTITLADRALVLWGQITLEELNVMSRLPHYCPVCAYHNWNLDGLVEMIWEYLDLLRIYTKPKVGPPLPRMHH